MKASFYFVKILKKLSYDDQIWMKAILCTHLMALGFRAVMLLQVILTL